MKKRLIYICMFASLLTFSSCNEALDVLEDITDAYESAYTIMLNLNKTWV